MKRAKRLMASDRLTEWFLVLHFAAKNRAAQLYFVHCYDMLTTVFNPFKKIFGTQIFFWYICM